MIAKEHTTPIEADIARPASACWVGATSRLAAECWLSKRGRGTQMSASLMRLCPTSDHVVLLLNLVAQGELDINAWAVMNTETPRWRWYAIVRWCVMWNLARLTNPPPVFGWPLWGV